MLEDLKPPSKELLCPIAETALTLEPADGLGTVYWTGSTESDNRYARDNLASAGVPSQRLHFIDPEKGRVTAVYQLWLD